MFFNTYPNYRRVEVTDYNDYSYIAAELGSVPTSVSFNHDMPKLRNAEGMFYKSVTISGEKEQSINENKMNFNEKRELDFGEIKLSTPSLISAPMMFWNRPLTYDELVIFAEKLNDIKKNNVRSNFDKWLNKDFDTICTENADTLFADIEKTENWKDAISWEREIDTLAILTDDESLKLCVIDKDYDGSTTKSFIFPSISIWVDEDTDDVREILRLIANKGWEVSTNIDMTGDLNKDDLSGGDNYLIRAYEYGNNTNEAFVCD
jgi:hypothetical protein